MEIGPRVVFLRGMLEENIHLDINGRNKWRSGDLHLSFQEFVYQRKDNTFHITMKLWIDLISPQDNIENTIYIHLQCKQDLAKSRSLFVIRLDCLSIRPMVFSGAPDLGMGIDKYFRFRQRIVQLSYLDFTQSGVTTIYLLSGNRT